MSPQEQLRELLAKDKFKENLPSFYPGAPDPETRLRCSAAVDKLISEILRRGYTSSDRAAALKETQSALRSLRHEDTEEFEQAAFYCTEALQVIGIQVPNALVLQARYGFLRGSILGFVVKIRKKA